MTISREEKIKALIEDAKDIEGMDTEALRLELETIDDESLDLGYTLMLIAQKLEG